MSGTDIDHGAARHVVISTTVSLFCGILAMFCFLFLAEPILGLPPFSRAPASFPHGYATHSRAEKTTSELLSEADTCAADADFVSPREDVDAIKVAPLI